MIEIASVQNLYKSTPVGVDVKRPVEKGEEFGVMLNSAMQLINQTNDLQNKASEEEIKFLLGETDNAHDVQVAATEARIALQYTTAVRDNILQSYQTIMNMQI